jgi:hypothetical protein
MLATTGIQPVTLQSPGADPRQSLAPSVLIGLVLDAVADLPQPAPCLSRFLPRCEINIHHLLSVLVYSYATGTFGSEDIEAAARFDPDIRYLCAYRSLSADSLRLCRRLYRPLIEHCLARLIEQAQVHPGQSSLLPPASPHPSAQSLAEARQCVGRAILTDTAGCE